MKNTAPTIEVTPMRTTAFKCPICDVLLCALDGTRLDSRDGVTVFCDSKACPAQEVVGHGSKEKDAYEIVKEKYKKS